MSLTFDFEAPEVHATVNGIAADAGASTTTLCTIPLSTAPFALSAGRAVIVETTCAGVDSAHGALQASEIAAISPGSYSAIVSTSFGSGLITNSLNGSGDLVVGWRNFNTVLSGISQSVAVRVTMRWVGS